MRLFTIPLFISFCLMAVSARAQIFTGTPQIIISQHSESGTDVGESNALGVINGRPAIVYRAKGSGGGIHYIRANDAPGSAWPEAGTRAVGFNSANPAVISNLSVAAGHPFIAVNVSPGGIVYVRRANNVDGDEAWTAALTTIPSTAPSVISTAIVNGNPAICFLNATAANRSLLYVRANNAEGTSWGTPVVVRTNSLGTHSSLAVVDGRPAIAYMHFENNQRKLTYVRAEDENGTTWGSHQVIDNNGQTGLYASMCIVDGQPAVAYQEWTNNDLRYIRANDVAGSSWGASKTLDSGADNSGYNLSLAVVNGVPAVSYLTRKPSSVELRFVRGGDAEGAGTWSAPQVLDIVMNASVAESAIGYSRTSLAEVNGTPAISYYDMINKDLKYIRSTTPAFVQQGPPILHVKMGGTGDGSSWAEAMGDIQAAINSPGAEQVWVAKGTYYPAANGLKMKNGVAIYGGFPDNDDDAGMDERNWEANPTILHGNNESVERRVVNNEFEEDDPLTGSAILDGFTITKGNAGYASGMVNIYASPTLTNLLITENISSGEGGGIYNWECAPTLTNVTISGNSTSFKGGGIYNENASVVLTNVTISGNSAQFEGGGIYNWNSAPLLTRVRIFGNSAQTGGGIANNNASPVLTNVLIYNNSSTHDAQSGGGIYNDNGSLPTLINVTIHNNSALLSGGAIFNNDFSSSKIYNSIIWDNGPQGYAGDLDPASSHNIIGTPGFFGALDPLFVDAAGLDFHLSLNSPAINAGSNDAYGDLSGAKDLDGNRRLWGAAIDMGAYENQDASLPVTLVHFEARVQENLVQLSWQTTEEVNASHFEVQRSADARTWQAIGTVAAKGYGRYIFTDYAQGPPLSTFNSPFSTAAAAALTYYRLKMVDMDGTYVYSVIRSVSFQKGENIVSKDKLYPNPTTEGIVILETADSQAAPAIRVFDGLGREVPVRVSGRNGKYFLETARLRPGIYHIQLQSGKSQRAMQLAVE